jgi:catechol 2,3-dioxygenase-like lactoylglutathione lyase family enzyme
MQLTGIHHLTAVTGNAPANHAFYGAVNLRPKRPARAGAAVRPAYVSLRGQLLSHRAK